MVTKMLDIQDAETSLEALLSLVREGTEVILTEGGTPLARLAPVEPSKQPRILGLHAHLGPAWMSDDFNDPLPDEFWLGEA